MISDQGDMTEYFILWGSVDLVVYIDFNYYLSNLYYILIRDSYRENYYNIFYRFKVGNYLVNYLTFLLISQGDLLCF